MSDLQQRPAHPGTLDEAHRLIDGLWGMIVGQSELKAQLDELAGQNEELRAELDELRDKMGKSSRNSSRAPSSDSPEQRATRRKKPKSPRSKGAQPGHKDHQRERMPESAADKIERYMPAAQCRCGADIAIGDEPFCRHQVFDIPEVKFSLVEHQIFGGKCTGCGRYHSAATPDSVPSGQMGPNLIALIAHLSGEYHLSIRQIQSYLRQHWQLNFCIGTISQAQGKANLALAEPWRAIGEHVRDQAVAHADETRHFRGTHCRWLWALVTTSACFLLTQCSRGKEAADELLGEFAGFLVTDDYVGYNRHDPARRQLCWPHLVRKFTDISERVGRGGQIGRRLLLIAHMVFRIRHRWQDRRITESVYYRRMHRLRASFKDTLERGARLRLDGRTRRQCRHLLTRESMCWTFLLDHRIPLDNNTAERALRPYVIWRKLSFASQSHQGDQFRPMILSVVGTARRLQVNSYQFLRTICTEHMQTGKVTTRLPLDLPRLPSR